MLIYNALMSVDPGSSIRHNLKSSVDTSWRLYCALEVSLPFKESKSSEAIRRQKLSASTIPWHAAAAGLTQEFHTEVRRLEINLKLTVRGSHGVRRGGSEKNTAFALKSIVNLSEAVDDQAVRGVLGYFDRWNRRAETVFNPDRGLRRVPRAPGEPELRCPWCSCQTMRWQPATGRLVCIHPECRTDAGERPRWTAGYEVIEDRLVFAWHPDGESA